MVNGKKNEIHRFLDERLKALNRADFIRPDPICIPHRFTQQEDIEIAGFFAAIFSWGNRRTIVQKTEVLMDYMDQQPHDFLIHHQASDLKKIMAFRHRTFQPEDLLYCIRFLALHYRGEISPAPSTGKPGGGKGVVSLESAFLAGMTEEDLDTRNAIIGFHDYFFSLDTAPARTRKHIATPVRQSTCKRINMFLRWMVRRGTDGVDFGIWKSILPAQLFCPLDIHVGRVARQLGLLQRSQNDWRAVEELTASLRTFDPKDPVKYDLVLFGLGVTEKHNGSGI